MSQTFLNASTWTLSGTGVYLGCIDKNWTQGRAVYGGILMAGALRALQSQVPDDRKLRTIMASFLAPILPDEPFVCEAVVLRSGSSFTHTRARLIQGDQVCVELSAGFGTERPPGWVIPAARPPECKRPEEGQPLPFVPGITPPFIRHFELALEPEFMPFSGRSRPGMRCWIRDRDITQPWNALKWVAMMDAPPPPVWTMLTGPAMGSTIHFQATLLNEGVGSMPAEEWVLFDATVNASDGAYCDYRCGLWSEDGTPLAIGKQIFADFSGGR